MSRFASGAILGFLLGAFLVVVLAGDSVGGPSHFRLPLKLEFQVGLGSEGDSNHRPAIVHVEEQSSNTTSVSSTEPLPADLAAIMEQRRSCKSPLVGTILDAPCRDELDCEFVAQLRQVEEEERNVPLPEVVAPVVQATITDQPISVAELYALAEQCEAAGEFPRADRFRRLAREIRQEISEMQSPTADTPAVETADSRAADDGYPLD